MKAFISGAETTARWYTERTQGFSLNLQPHANTQCQHLSRTHAETRCQVCELHSNITYARASQQVQAHDPELVTDRAPAFQRQRAGDHLWKN